MNKITEQIYICNKDDIGSEQTLLSKGFTHVLNLACDVSDPYYEKILMVKVGLVSRKSMDRKWIKTATDILLYLLSNGNKILVHCIAGNNRTPYIISKVFARLNNTDWRTEFEKIKSQRPSAYIEDWMT